MLSRETICEVGELVCRLKVIFAERRIRQRDFAKSVRIAESHFSRIANGSVIPSLDVAFKIARELQLNIEDIWQPE